MEYNNNILLPIINPPRRLNSNVHGSHSNSIRIPQHYLSTLHSFTLLIITRPSSNLRNKALSRFKPSTLRQAAP